MTAEAAAEEVPAPRPAVGGWHYAEWLSELAGTAILVFGALSAITLVFHQGAVIGKWVPSTSLRLLLVGVTVAVVLNLIAISPLGRRSGAHVNPAVTLAFWITGHVHPHDLGGYWAGQFAGALLGAGLVRVVWGSDAASVNYGAIRPTVSTLEAVGVEAALTAALVFTLFVFLSSKSTARWTPVAVGIVVALAIRLGGRATGTGINPARSLGTNIVAGDFGFWWIYVVAPTAGAVLVALVWKLGPRVVLTAKLFHDPWYPSVLRTHLPALPPRA